MKDENINKEELFDKTLIYLADNEFRNRILLILKEKPKFVLTEFIIKKRTYLDIGNELNSSEKSIQNMILKVVLAIVNLYERNEYFKHDDLTLKIYFDFCLNSRNLVTELNIKNIDIILSLMPHDVRNRLHDLYYSISRTIGKQKDERNAYHVVKFHIKRYEKTPEIYALLANRESIYRIS